MIGRELYSIKEARELLGGISRKLDLRASALGKSSQRGPGLPAVHRRFGDHGAYREIDDESEPNQGLCPLTDVGAEVPALLSVARRWQQIA